MQKYTKGISGKMILLSTVFFTTFVSVIIYSIVQIKEVSDELVNTLENRIPRINSVLKMESANNALLRWSWASYEDKENYEKVLPNIEKSLNDFDEAYSVFINTNGGDQFKDLLKDSPEVWGRIKKTSYENIKLLQQNTNSSRDIYKSNITNVIRPDMKKMTDLLSLTNTKQKEFTNTEKENTLKHLQQMIFILVSISVIGCLFILIFSFLFSKKLIQSLRHISSEIEKTSSIVLNASQLIANSSEKLSYSTNEQASSLEETTSAIEEMNSMVSKSSENSKNTAQISNQSKDQAREGQNVVQKMLDAMNEIDSSNGQILNQVHQSNDQLTEILKVIQNISTKTKVINDIVFQTRLLSFNASVEAARAGEHGRGFSVVAEEVGKLAQMSGDAATEISKMLNESLKNVEDIVKDTKSKVNELVVIGKEKVDTGKNVAHQCDQVLKQIVTNVTEVNDMSMEISFATEEQSRGVDEINRAMIRLNTVTHTNSSTGEQLAKASSDLSHEAEVLRTSISELIEVIEGDAAEKAA